MTKKSFTWSVRVYYEDTDAAGVVFYANYLRYLERARTECLRRIGFSQTDLVAKEGIVFAVRRLSIDYLRPARLDDVLKVQSTIAKLAAASIYFSQKVVAEGGVVICDADVHIVCLDAAKLKPVPLPHFFRLKLIHAS